MDRVALASEYDAALQAWLARRDEDALRAASELGGRALAAGVGLLEVVAAHRGAVRADAFDVADAFLREALSPWQAALAREREAAAAANEEFESLAYAISHDLRAPLRAIDGFSRILEEDAAERLTEEDRRHLVRVRQGVAHAATLLDGLLALSRVARAELRPERVDLGEIAARILERLRGREPARDVVVHVASPLVAEGDRALVTLALEKLLENAWKFTSKRVKARIEVGWRDEAERVVHYVRDDGVGFDMAYAAKLFRAFQRLHAPADFPGTGIGLATVQRIVHRHGGRVWAEGAPDGGATFYFTLGSGASAR